MPYSTEIGQKFHEQFLAAVRTPAPDGRLQSARTFNSLLGLFDELRKKLTGKLRLAELYEIGLVVRTECDRLSEARDPLADRLRKIILPTYVTLQKLIPESELKRAQAITALHAPAELRGTPFREVRNLLAGVFAEIDDQRPSEDESAWIDQLIDHCGRLLIDQGHSVSIDLSNNKHVLRDLVYYDWSWGATRQAIQTIGWSGPLDEDKRPLTDMSTLVRFAQSSSTSTESVGAPLREGQKFRLARFNIDLLLNLAAWWNAARRNKEFKPDEDLARLWEGLADWDDKDKKRLLPCKNEPLEQNTRCVDLHPHGNYAPETDAERRAPDESPTGWPTWHETKRRWLTRRDVAGGGYAIEFWAANHPYLHHLFARWGWLKTSWAASPTRPVPSRSKRQTWEMDYLLKRLSDEAHITLEGGWDDKKGEKRCLRLALNKLLPTHIEELREAGVRLTPANDEETDPPSPTRTPQTGYAEAEADATVGFVNIGPPRTGKSHLLMTILSRLPRSLGGTNWDLPGGGREFLLRYRKDWEKLNLTTQGKEAATIIIECNLFPLRRRFSLHYHDVLGDYCKIETVVRGGNLADTFRENLGDELNHSIAVGFTIDSRAFLVHHANGHEPTPDVPPGVTEFGDTVSDLSSLLLSMDDNGVTGAEGSPVVLLIAQVDRLGLTEPLGFEAELLPNQLEDSDESLSTKITNALRRPSNSLRIQHQFLGFRLSQPGTLLTRMYETMFGGEEVNVTRPVAAFLTTGLHKLVSGVPKSTNALLGVEQFADWLTRQLVDRWGGEQLQVIQAIHKFLKALVQKTADQREPLREGVENVKNPGFWKVFKGEEKKRKTLADLVERLNSWTAEPLVTADLDQLQNNPQQIEAKYELALKLFEKIAKLAVAAQTLAKKYDHLAAGSAGGHQ